MAGDQKKCVLADEDMRHVLAHLGRRHEGAEAIDDGSLREPEPRDREPRADRAAPPIPLPIGEALADVLGAPGVTVIVAGLPDGAGLSAGVDGRDGTWRLASGELDGLTMFLPDSAFRFTLGVSATAAVEGGGARTIARLAVSIDTAAGVPATDGGA